MKYISNHHSRRISKLAIAGIIVAIIALISFVGAVGARFWYENQLEPVSESSKIVVVDIPKGASVQEIADTLYQKQVIKNSQAFQWYVRNNSLVESMKAGTYELDASKTTPEIVSIITEGDIKERLFTIIPGQSINQIKNSLLEFGFSESEVNSALNPNSYQNHPALVAKPSNASLEGYLYPESFKTDSSTTAKSLIEKSLDEMADAVTPELIESWQKQGLGIHQAITLAAIVENEVSSYDDRRKAAQVFLKRLDEGIKLQSNATDNSPPEYDTYTIIGLPPGPISNVTETSLQAVAYPSSTDYLYFVSGKDCITRFSQQLSEHEALIDKYGVATPEDKCR